MTAPQATPPADWQRRIVKNPKILAGKPTVKGTRISVELVMELLESGWSEEAILRNYPRLILDDIAACRKFAATDEPLSYVSWEQLMARLDDKDKDDFANPV